MDKKKTGNLIREARQRKNYTQNELGMMLGVTNKAVSRWENGESFPDIGILEPLSRLLELPIQDIVTGESAADQESAVTELVRLAKLQEQRKREKRILYLSLGSIRAGKVPFGMELSSLGPFLNNQLSVVYALNVIFLAVEMYRMLKERIRLHPGCIISPAAIYLNFFYIDLLGRMDSLDSVRHAMDRGTVLILLEAALGIVTLTIQSRHYRSRASDSLRQSQ